MILRPRRVMEPVRGIPRESGDDPNLDLVITSFGAYSPRERG